MGYKILKWYCIVTGGLYVLWMVGVVVMVFWKWVVGVGS